MSTVTTGTSNREGPRFRLRWSPVDGAELRCQHCGEWWSVGEHAADYWVIGNWSRCRLCVREGNRLFVAKKLADNEAFRLAERGRRIRYRVWLRKHHPDLVRALGREQQARHRAAMRAKRQAAAA